MNTVNNRRPIRSREERAAVDALALGSSENAGDGSEENPGVGEDAGDAAVSVASVDENLGSEDLVSEMPGSEITGSENPGSEVLDAENGGSELLDAEDPGSENLGGENLGIEEAEDGAPVGVGPAGGNAVEGSGSEASSPGTTLGEAAPAVREKGRVGRPRTRGVSQRDVPESGRGGNGAGAAVRDGTVIPVGDDELERIRDLAKAQGFVLFREPRARQFRPEPDSKGGVRTSCRLSSGARRELEQARLELNMSYSEIIERGIYMFLESRNLLSEAAGFRS